MIESVTYYAIKLRDSECYITKRDTDNFYHPEVFPPRLFHREQDCKTHINTYLKNRPNERIVNCQLVSITIQFPGARP